MIGAMGKFAKKCRDALDIAEDIFWVSVAVVDFYKVPLLAAVLAIVAVLAIGYVL